jgi:transposase
MRPRISASKKTLDELRYRVKAASTAGDLTLFRKTSAVLLALEGNSFEFVAKIISVTAETVGIWLQQFMLKRWQTLTNGKSSGRPPKLRKSQKQKLVDVIKRGPEAAGYPGGCWRSPMIQDYIYRTFGVFYSVFYIAQLLKNLGLSFQKARFVSDHLDDSRRQTWLTVTWPHILKLSKRYGSAILFGDEASFPQWGSLSYTWAPRGEQPVVKTSGKRKGYKVFGLIEYFSGKFFAMAQESRLTSDTYQSFLLGVLSKTRKHLIIIQDGARYHTSKQMQTFFKSHADRLTVFQLPCYSPDFNPIEKLWKKIKERGVHMRYFSSFEALKAKVDEMLFCFADARQEVLALFGFYDPDRLASKT